MAISLSRHRIFDVIGLLVRLGLAGIWIYSGVEKAADPMNTQLAVAAYRLLPDSAVPLVAGVLPYLELALGALLLFGLTTRWAAVLSALVLAGFVVGVVSAWARGLSIDCGCFGGGGEIDPSQTHYLGAVLRDVGFLAMAGWLIWRPRTPLSVDGLARPAADQDHDVDDAEDSAESAR